MKVCKTVRVPYTEHYYVTRHCQDGRPGHIGRDGYHGQNGRVGKVTVIPRSKALEPVRPRGMAPISSIQSTFALSKNVWSEKAGALSLFGPGSVISDTYRFWEGRIDRTISFHWEATEYQPNELAGHVSFHVTDFNISYAFPNDLWVVAEETTNGDHTEVRIKHVAKEEDLQKLKVVDITGSGTGTVLEILDEAGISEFVDSEFYIESDWNKTIGDRKDYKQWVEPQYVQRVGNRFYIAIGKLPIKEKYLKHGKDLELELTVRRSLGSKSKLVGEYKLEKDLGTSKPVEIDMDDIDF